MGLVCFAGGDTSKQGKPGETRGNQGKPGETRGNQGKPGKTNETQGKQRKTRGTPSINKRNTFQSMGFLSKQGQYFTVKWKRKAIASDGGYSVIGGRYCLLA